MNWVYDIPTWLFAVVVGAFCVTLACGGHVLLRRFVTRELLLRHNDVAGFVASLVGVIYAVLLSFVVVVVWQEYDTATAVAQKEASAVADLYHIAYGLPVKERTQMQHDLGRYIHLMLAEEWPLMQHGLSSDNASRMGHQVLHGIVAFNPRTQAEGEIRTEGLRDVQTFLDARRERLQENETSLPRILWTTLIFGALVTVGFTYFFGMDSARLQISMTAGLTLVIAMMFVLIVELDFPFRGDTRVQPEVWTDMVHEMGAGLPEKVYSS